MKDAREIRRETWEAADRNTESRSERESWRQREVHETEARLRRTFRDQPHRGARPQDQLDRLERIRDTSGMRHLPEFDAKRLAAAEDREIATNPRGFLRAHAGEPLDAATERRVWEAMERRDPG